MTRKYAQITCPSGNIGDDFQSLAAGLHLPEPASFFVEREKIQDWPRDVPVTVIMNGWFSYSTQSWPPALSIDPIFVGFHVTERFKPAVMQHVDYLKLYAPIGARDAATTAFLRSIGVEAETTHCLTLTFPTRLTAPKPGKVFIVDAEGIAIPRSLRANAVKMTHVMPPLNHEVTLPFGRQLLQKYRDEARLVITTRLHAALPCIAMGIPVVFFGDPTDGRTSIVRDIGGRIYNARLHRKSLARGGLGRLLENVDWEPAALDVSQKKAELAEAVTSRLRRRAGHIRT